MQDTVVDVTEWQMRGFKTLTEQVAELRTLAANPRQRLRTGMPSLDLLVLGPAAGEVFTFLGRSFVGKSLIATNIMMNNPDRKIIFFSLEMPDHQVLQRLYAHYADINGREVSRMTMQNKLPETLDFMPDRFKHQVVIDADGITLGDMSAYVEQYEAWYGDRPEAVIIDYLEEIAGSKASGEGWVRTEATASSLKAWSKREKMPVVVLHQANQKTEPWEPPTQSSGKGGGYTESDVVVGIWRPGFDPNLGDVERMRLKDELHMNVLKNRVTGRTTVGRELRFKMSDSLMLVDLDFEANRRFYGDN